MGVRKLYILFVLSGLALLGCQNQSSQDINPFSSQPILEEDGIYWTLKNSPLRMTSFPVRWGHQVELSESIKIGCESAIQTIEESSNLTFIKVNAQEDADIYIKTSALDLTQNHQGMTEVRIVNDQLRYAEISFDSELVYSRDPKPNEIDAESVCLHELGHALGLAHSHDKLSVMYFGLVQGTKKRSFSEGDIERLKFLYSDNVEPRDE